MNRPALALAVAVITSTTLTNAAEAGIRLGFGLPLGVFVASSLAQGAQRSPYTGPRAADRMYAERKAREARIAAARRQAAGKQQAAEIAARREAAAVAEARARKAKQAEVAKDEATEAKVQTAVSDSKPLTEAAPAIFVPDAPAATSAAATSDQVAEVATVGVIDDAVKIKAPTTQPVAPAAKTQKTASITENVETKPVAKPSTKSTAGCRRFSALVGALIDVPCE